jgi:hypothetical protein
MLNDFKLSAAQSERLQLALYRVRDNAANTEDHLIATLHDLALRYAGENERLHVVTAEMTTGLHEVSVSRTLKAAKTASADSLSRALGE